MIYHYQVDDQLGNQDTPIYNIRQFSKFTKSYILLIAYICGAYCALGFQNVLITECNHRFEKYFCASEITPLSKGAWGFPKR